MRTENVQPESFPSLAALRQANDELVGEIPDDYAHLNEAECAANDARVEEFLARAVATGAHLDSPSDRKAAQSLIDFWVASSYTQRAHKPQTPVQSRRPNVLLDPVD